MTNPFTKSESNSRTKNDLNLKKKKSIFECFDDLLQKGKQQNQNFLPTQFGKR